jgi:hypothetical protein
MFTIAVAVTGAAGVAFAQQVPKLKGTDLVVNGESFFAASNIRDELTRLARADGVLGANDKFGQVAVSGAPIASIVNQYKNCNPKPKYLVSDGAGIDLMSNGNMTTLGNTLKQYLDEMKKGGTKCLLWMIYPDPQGANWATLKKNQDQWALTVPPIINGCKDPKTLLIDLRPVWAGKYSQYTSDGIHCTNAGGTATAEAFWKVMKADNWAFFDTTGGVIVDVKEKNVKSNLFHANSLVKANGCIAVSLSLDKPTDVCVKLTTISGRTVFIAQKSALVAGEQALEFNTGHITSGVYCCVVGAGQYSSKSTVIVP